MSKEIKKIIIEAVKRYNFEDKKLIEGKLNEVKFKIDLLDHDMSYYKKIERAIKKIKTYLKKSGLDYNKGMGYSVSSTNTSSSRDGESKQRTRVTARVKLDKFEEKVKASEFTSKQIKDGVSEIISSYDLNLIDIKNRENKPEEIIFTIKL